MKIIDISIPINNNTVVYPKNAPVEIEKFATLPADSSNLSKITTGSHTATHVDAPLHVRENGAPLDAIPLENYIGPAKVLDFSDLGPGELIKISDLEKHDIVAGDRILAKTSNSDRGYEEFYDDFVALDGDAADYLAGQKIALFAIDYLSIKQRGSDDNRAHTSLLDNKIAIVEGVNLRDVEAGQYTLYCPPLKLTGPEIDGAPCRAVLVQE
jgi:arylformamidase